MLQSPPCVKNVVRDRKPGANAPPSEDDFQKIQKQTDSEAIGKASTEREMPKVSFASQIMKIL